MKTLRNNSLMIFILLSVAIAFGQARPALAQSGKFASGEYFFEEKEALPVELELRFQVNTEEELQAQLAKTLPPIILKKVHLKMDGPEAVKLTTKALSYQQLGKFNAALAVMKKEGLKTKGASTMFIPLSASISDLKAAQSFVHLLHVMQAYNEMPTFGHFLKMSTHPDYPASTHQLYEDFIYRQGADLLGMGRAAWAGPVSAAKEMVLREPEKTMALLEKDAKVSPLSLLMSLHPEEELSQALQKSDDHSGKYQRRGLAFALPARSFQVSDEARNLLGLYSSVLKFGNYRPDKLIGATAGIPASEVTKLREMLSSTGEEKAISKHPLIVRIQLEDVENTDPQTMKEIYENQYKKIMDAYEGSHPLFLPNLTQGNRPVALPRGVESVVFHRKSFQGSNIRGTHNVSLVNPHLVAVLNNKYFEARLWNKFVPGAMPDTKLLREVVGNPGGGEKASITMERMQSMVSTIKAAYPKGFVIKGSYDVGTEKTGLITDKTDIFKAYQTYLESDYESFYSDLLLKLAGSSTDYVVEESQKHPGYLGYRIKELFSKPEMTIIQDRLRIDKEFRVEVVAGRVLGKGSTIERYGYLNPSTAPAIPEHLFTKAEEYTQTIIDRLPDHLRGMSFTMDIALLEDGSFAVIESNPGGNSGFLAMEKKSIIALNEFLKTYPELKAKGLIPAGMNDRKQLKFIKDHIREFSMDQKVHFPGLKIASSKVDRLGVKRSPLVGFESFSRTSWRLEKIVQLKMMTASTATSPIHEDSSECASTVSLKQVLPTVEHFVQVEENSASFMKHPIVLDIIDKVPTHPQDRIRALALIGTYLKLVGAGADGGKSINTGLLELQREIASTTLDLVDLP